jgi:hypothetical protein
LRALTSAFVAKSLHLPRRRSARAALREIRAEVRDIRGRSWDVEDPDAIRAWAERYGEDSLRENVDSEISGPLYIAVAAIADLGIDWPAADISRSVGRRLSQDRPKHGSAR